MFSGLRFYSRVIARTIFSLKTLVYISVSTWTFKHQIFKIFKTTLRNHINPIFIPYFSGFMLFRVQVFQGLGFPRSRFFRVQDFQGPGFSGSGSKVRVQVLEVADLKNLITFFMLSLLHTVSKIGMYGMLYILTLFSLKAILI